MTCPYAPQAAVLIAHESSILNLVRSARPWRYANSGKLEPREAFELILTMPDAPHALALLRTYVECVNVDSRSPWTISALPTYSGSTTGRRMATISSGPVELFYVWFATKTGRVTQWGLRLDGPVTDTANAWATPHPSGDTHLEGKSLADLLEVLADPDAERAVKDTWSSRSTTRNPNWHNPFLAAYLCPSESDGTSALEPYDAGADPSAIERRYMERVVRQRLHQRQLRTTALRHYPHACAYCGTDVFETLETAHLVADSAGGEASLHNVRLLCANHHRAFDAGLLTWDGTAFFPVDGSPPVPPIPRPTSGSRP